MTILALILAVDLMIVLTSTEAEFQRIKEKLSPWDLFTCVYAPFFILQTGLVRVGAIRRADNDQDSE